MDIEKIRQYAIDRYACANSKYDGRPYYIHTDMVANVLRKFWYVFKFQEDRVNTEGAAHCHDLCEDARESFNNIKDNTNCEIAKIVLSVTDIPEENRLLRHLYTMPKTVKDYRGIILKMCDMHANASYSKTHGSSMFSKYVEEYKYRKPIFKKALTWYKNYINFDVLDLFWKELDDIHN